MSGKLNRQVPPWLALVAALCACSGHPTNPTTDGVDADQADADAVVADVDAKPGADADGADGKDAADVVDATDAAIPGDSDDSDTSDVGAGCPGGPFCACQSDSDCDSAKCLETPEGHTCAPTCVEAGCPAGYACKPLGSGDPVNYCVASHLSLCAPCGTNKDCQTQGVTDALCVDYGSVGHFCGGACATDNACGAGYACVDVPDPVGGGKTVKQCKAKSNACSCSVWAKTAGTVTACSNSNPAGTCSGTRTCDGSGLTACSAKTPAAETCNNLDDDCNGAADDLPIDATCANSAYTADGALIGTCVGKRVCSGGAELCQGAKTPKAESCNGEDDNCDGTTDEGFAWSDPVSGGSLAIGAACGAGACAGGNVMCASFSSAACSSAVKASAEACNGQDDDCNGTTDEGTCGDGNPCTADVCDGGASTCKHLAVEAPCDDGDPCTLADACSATTCAGAPLACDDGNPCTIDTCDGKTGACLFANKTGSCTDGNACTSGDTCGAIPGGGWGCLPGVTVNCDDSNPCTDDTCTTGSGCSYASNNATQACYDGPPGTAGTGLCHGGLRYCAAGVLASACVEQVVPSAELCNGLDDSCNGITDEGCSAASVTLSFAAAQTAGKSGTLAANVQLAPDRPANTLQTPASPHRLALGVLAWFVHLVTGN